MLLFLIFILVSKTTCKQFNYVTRRDIGSGVFSGNAYYSGSYTKIKNYNNNGGSGAYSQMVNKGSGAYSQMVNKGSGAYSQMVNKGSGAYSQMVNKGSGAYSQALNKGSGAYSQALNKGSGAYNKGSGPYSQKGSGNKIYNAFQPTLEPTESLPRVIQAPRPTQRPTVSIPKIKVDPPPDLFTVPQIPLTFQITQGGSGPAKYRLQKIKDAVSKVAIKNLDIKPEAITNMEVFKRYSNGRSLFTEANYVIQYNITIVPSDIGESIPNLAYTRMKSTVIEQYKSIKFNADIFAVSHIRLNVSELNVADYFLLFPAKLLTANSTTTNYNVISSTGGANTTNYMNILFGVSIGVFLAFMLVLYGYLARKNTKSVPY